MLQNKNKRSKQKTNSLLESKIFKHSNYFSIFFGALGLFIYPLVFGFLAVLIGKIGLINKQKYSLIGIVIGIISISYYFLVLNIYNDKLGYFISIIFAFFLIIYFMNWLIKKYG